MTTPEDTILREKIMQRFVAAFQDGFGCATKRDYIARDELHTDYIMHLITLHTQKAEVKAEIKGKVAAYNQMIMGAGEYHDDPYRYVVPIEHISEYLAGLMKFDLASSNPIYREKAQLTNPTEAGEK